MIRIGVDFGGTKIEAAAIDEGGAFLARVRAPNPRSYEAALTAVAELVARAEADAGTKALAVGVGTPGSVSPSTGLMRNASSIWLNGKPLPVDLERVLGRPVRIANDADCFALSEALPEHRQSVVFGAIIGTGCGGGIVVDGKPLTGHNNFGGEWGHTPLPWPTAAELAENHLCWCGRANCLETWISGTAVEADYARATERKLVASEIATEAAAGAPEAIAAIERLASRLGRGLAAICNILDPDLIVLGGGLSNIPSLYGGTMIETLKTSVFSDVFETPVRPPNHGDSSGVRGAAWLT